MKELERENGRLKRLVVDLSLGKAILRDRSRGKLLSPEARQRAVGHAIVHYGVWVRAIPAKHLFAPSATSLLMHRKRYLQQYAYDFIEMCSPLWSKPRVQRAAARAQETN